MGLRKFFREDPAHKPHLSYSQQGEDLTLLRLLGNKAEGFFVDVGAFHPIKYSNTYIFYNKGWRGINVEPNPDVQKEFKKHRPGDMTLNTAVGSSAAKLSYYKFNHPAVNSFSAEHVEKWKKMPGFKLEEVVEVEVQKLSTLLDNHLPKGKKIDFMTVDVEDFDLQVLKSNDWNLYRPILLLVEEDLIQYPTFKDSPIVSYLDSKNYSLATICNGTLFFKDNLA